MIASDIFEYDELVEVIFDCQFKGQKGNLAYVSEESLQIEVLIEHEDIEGRTCMSYFTGFTTDIKKVTE